ncbi:MAG: endolytic transglycosylase MltG, partial [Firmicutes bacterium]|nr:endolytic transglycosylase MltG [Bacillota bacterium]
MAKNRHEYDTWPSEGGFDDQNQAYGPEQPHVQADPYAEGKTDGDGGWTEYVPSEEGMRPMPPARDFPPEGWEDQAPPPSPGRGHVYMSGEQLDNNGYKLPGELDMHDPQSARDFRPIRQRRDRRFGCLGGLMYAVFVISLSVILTCLGWMAANDILALNKPLLTATVILPKEDFSTKVVDVKEDIKDSSGKVTGQKTVQKLMQVADIDKVAKILKDNGLIEYEFLFKFYAGISHAEQKMDPGTYVLSTNFDYRALVTKMQAGSPAQVPTTLIFPEGWTMEKIFQNMADNDVCSYNALMNAAANIDFDYSFLKDLNLPLGDATRLEGFLFPDTYTFYQGMPARAAISKFLDNFNSKLTKDMLDQCAARGITLRDAVNIGSMIEKEAGVVKQNDGTTKDDRNRISAVIYNRLGKDMPLQVDSTILYTHQDWNPKVPGTPALAELLQQTQEDPYNTYSNKGLPPSPICNPGIAAINAALYPTAGSKDYYYALNKNTGLHEFFTNGDA